MVYGTTMGCIGAMYPFDNREDVDFFLHLEMYMRVENQPLSGRDHMMFRSAYGPCKVILIKKYLGCDWWWFMWIIW